MIIVVCPWLGRKGHVLANFFLPLLMPMKALAQDVWTLVTSVQQVLDVAPEYQDAAAAARAQPDVPSC